VREARAGLPTLVIAGTTAAAQRFDAKPFVRRVLDESCARGDPPPKDITITNTGTER